MKHREKACDIQRSLSITLKEAERVYKICRDEFERLNLDAVIYRERLLVHRVKEEVSRFIINKAKEIKSLMYREIARKTWGSIGSDIQNKRGASVSAVDICHNGTYYRYEGNKHLEAGLQKALSDIFKLTKGTHTWSVNLHQDFGILGNTAAASKVM